MPHYYKTSRGTLIDLDQVSCVQPIERLDRAQIVIDGASVTMDGEEVAEILEAVESRMKRPYEGARTL